MKNHNREPLPGCPDFEIEWFQSDTGWTFQLWYNGHRSFGMSEFSGTLKGVRSAWKEHLKKISDAIDYLSFDEEARDLSEPWTDADVTTSAKSS